MFLDIFNWMLARVPGFMRPGVGWLIDGLRSLTNYVSQRWSSLGSLASLWRTRVLYWLRRGIDFAVTFTTFMTWLVVIFVPGAIAAKAAQLVTYVKSVVAAAVNFLAGRLEALRQWASDVTDDLLDLLSRLKEYAKYWINKLVVGVGDLIRALAHVLSGPDVLAEWLVAAMWRAMARLVYAQRDRIVSWLTRESVAFTRWLALEVENIIMRWL